MSLPQEAETTRKKLAAQEERIKLLVQTDKGHKFVVFSKPSVTVRQLRRTCELMGQKLYCTLYEEFVVTGIQGPVPPPTPSLSLPPPSMPPTRLGRLDVTSWADGAHPASLRPQYTTYAWCGECDVSFDVYVPDPSAGSVLQAGEGRYLFNTDKQLFRFDNFPAGGQGNTTQILDCSQASLEKPMCDTYVMDWDAAECQSAPAAYSIPVFDLPKEAYRSNEKSTATTDYYSATYATGPFSRSDWLVDVMTGLPKQTWTWGSMPFPPADFLAGYMEYTHFSKDPVDDSLFDPMKIPGAPQCQPGNGEMLKRSMQNYANIYAQYQQGSEL